MAEESQKRPRDFGELRKFIADTELATEKQIEGSAAHLGAGFAIFVTFGLAIVLLDYWNPPGLLFEVVGLIGTALGLLVYKLVTLKRKSGAPKP